jgi:hypothetical protein
VLIPTFLRPRAPGARGLRSAFGKRDSGGLELGSRQFTHEIHSAIPAIPLLVGYTAHHVVWRELADAGTLHV